MQGIPVVALVYQWYMIERDITDGAQRILAWRITQGEPQVQDVVFPTLMDPRGALDYASWWVVVHLGPLGLNEFDSSADKVVSQPSKNDDPYHIENPIHDGPS